MSKGFGEKIMVGALALLLWTLPLASVPNPKVIGKVIGSNGASLGGVALPNQATILNNDELRTGPNGKALVQFSPASRATLSEDTTVKFARTGTTYFGEMSSGSLVVETRGVHSLVVQTPKYKVEPLDDVNTIYLVAIMPNRSTVVAAKDGRIAITEINSGLKYVLPQGEYAAIPAGASGVPGQQGQGSQQTTGTTGGRITKVPWHIGSLSHAASIGLVAAIAVGTAAAIAIPLAVSGPAVSPSTP